MKRLPNSALTIGLVVLILGTSCSNKSPLAARAALMPPQVHAMIVEQQPQKPLSVTGRVWAASRRQLGFSAAGVITYLGVEVGSRVRAGQVLATLDRAEANARLGEVAAHERLAQREWQDTSKLTAAGALPERQQIQAETSLQIAKAEMAQTHAVLARRVIVSPVDGIVFKRLFTPGEVVDPGRPVLIVDETSQLVVDCSLVASEVSRVRKGDHAQVRVGDERWRAEVFSVSSAPEDDGALYSVRVRLGAMKQTPPLGLLVSVDFLDSVKGMTMQVGLPAIMNRHDQDYVFVVSQADGRSFATLRRIELGRAYGQITDVIAGLTPGERIVAEGGDFLHDGQIVSVAQ